MIGQHTQAGGATAQATIVVEDRDMRAGFTIVPNRLLFARGLSHGAKLTYALLLGYAWQDGSCFPGQERLAADLDVERKAVMRYLKELKDSGLVRVVRRGLGMTNLYILPRLADVPFLVLQEVLPSDVPFTGHQEVPPGGPAETLPTGHNEDAPTKTQKTNNSSRFDAQESCAQEKEPRAKGDGTLSKNASRLGRPVKAQRPGSRMQAEAPKKDDDRDLSADLLAELAPLRQALRDTASARATATRLRRLLDRSGLSEPIFLRLTNRAGGQAMASLRAGAIAGSGMAYFFGCLEQLIERAESQASSSRGSRDSSPVIVAAELAGEPSTDEAGGEDSVWAGIRRYLAGIMPAHTYRQMVAPTAMLEDDGSAVRVAVQAAFQRDWLIRSLQARIRDALAEQGRVGTTVEFVVVPSTSEAMASS